MALGLVFAMLALKLLLAHHARRLREAGYRQTAANLQAALKPHTRRSDADRYLSGRGLKYQQEWGPGSVGFDDFVPIGGHESDFGLFRAYDMPAVLIRYAPAASRGSRPGRVGSPDDGMEYREWPMDCL